MEWGRQANNISGHYKRGLAMALNLSVGNLGGIAATMIFRKGDSPRFLLGCTSYLLSRYCLSTDFNPFLISVGFEVVAISLGILSGCVAVLAYNHINGRRDSIEKRQRGLVSEEVLQEQKRQGERAISFRYVL